MRNIENNATTANVSTASDVSTQKPLSAKQIAHRAKLAAAKAEREAAKPAKPEPVAPVRHGGYSTANIQRTAAVFLAMRTSFGGVVSNRDDAYLLAMHKAASTSPDKRTATLAALADACETFQPAAIAAGVASVKPHDGGVLVRVCKAGNIEHPAATAGLAAVLTERGEARIRLLLKKQSEAAKA